MKYCSYFKDWAVVHSKGEGQELVHYRRTSAALLSRRLPLTLVSLCWAVLCGGRVEGVGSEGPRLPQSHFTRRPISFITAAHNPGVEHEPE